MTGRITLSDRAVLGERAPSRLIGKSACDGEIWAARERVFCADPDRVREVVVHVIGWPPLAGIEPPQTISVPVQTAAGNARPPVGVEV